MGRLKAIFGVVGALGSIVYFTGLLHYFADAGGPAFDPQTGGMDGTGGLMPTLLGLGAIVALVCISLYVKVLRASSQTRSLIPRVATDDGESEIDADAVVARHMARRAAEAEAEAEAASSVPMPPAVREDRRVAAPVGEDVGPATRPSFGRRVR